MQTQQGAAADPLQRALLFGNYQFQARFRRRLSLIVVTLRKSFEYSNKGDFVVIREYAKGDAVLIKRTGRLGYVHEVADTGKGVRYLVLSQDLMMDEEIELVALSLDGQSRYIENPSKLD